VRVDLVLNGRAAGLEARSDEMLLEALRREGLLSVRATCGIGVCGACTVLLDGEAVSSCLTLAATAEGREVTTAEGLEASDPVALAFSEGHAFQCGWCTPGFVLTAKALLAEDPHPSDEAIARALGGNICRCGSYLRIAEAVRRCAS
jgi:aerobic-type carbon monoxide dehydrogenase small subunit (CoxS/CutS family)